MCVCVCVCARICVCMKGRCCCNKNVHFDDAAKANISLFTGTVNTDYNACVLLFKLTINQEYVVF